MGRRIFRAMSRAVGPPVIITSGAVGPPTGAMKEETMHLIDMDSPRQAPLGKKEVNEEPNNVALMTFWFGMLTAVSVTMTIGNKFIMHHYHYPNFITLLQNGTAVGFLLGGNLAGLIEFKAFTVTQWKIFAVNAVLLAAQILSSLLALPHVAVATTIVFRNAATIAGAGIDYTFFGKTFSKASVASLGMTTIGMMFYAGNDLNYSSVGYFWLLVNAIATLANIFWNRVYISAYTKTKEQTTQGITFIQQVETLPIMMVLATANDEWKALPLLSELSFNDQWVLAATCIGGYVISITYSKVFSLASGTSVMLASTANKAISIVFAWFVFEDILLPNQILGLATCIGGAVWYAIESKR